MKAAYYFEVPVNQYVEYTKHIITGLYGVNPDKFKVIRDNIRYVRVEINTDQQIPFINSLPKTIISDTPITYNADSKLVAIVGDKIHSTIEDFLHPIGNYYSSSNKISLSADELKTIIKQLAREQKITKFAELSNNRFIVYIQPYLVTAMVKVVDNILTITICNTLNGLFDIDDGYCPLLSDLNEGLIKWRNDGILFAPIQLPNYV